MVTTLEEALYSRLSGFAALTNLVGLRIYPLEAPQDSPRPHVVYTRDITETISAFGSDTGNVKVVMEISAWATTYDSALAICKQIKAALQRWSGTYDSVVIQDTFIDTEFQDFESDTAGVRVSQNYIIWFKV